MSSHDCVQGGVGHGKRNATMHRYYMSDADAAYVIDAVSWIATQGSRAGVHARVRRECVFVLVLVALIVFALGWSLLPLYTAHADTGEWRHASQVRPSPARVCGYCMASRCGLH